jgi:hypothetical protein
VTRIAAHRNPYWLAPSIVIAVPLVLGTLGAWLGVLRPDVGLFLVGMAVFLALVASAALAAAAAYATAAARPWRRSALGAALVPGSVALGALLFARCSAAPELDDVSTDLADRPAFASDAARVLADSGALAERLAALAEQQRRAYPDIGPVLLSEPADAAFARASRAARGLRGWELVREDPARRELEARATTRVFRFVDEVVIRVRPDAAGSRVDVRSRSPGRAGFGAHAARIREFARALREAPP